MNKKSDLLVTDSKNKTFSESVPSVYDGDTPFITFAIPKKGESVVIGKLWGTKGVLSFEGDEVWA